MVLTEPDSTALAVAVRRLEQPSLAGRLAALAGKPAGFALRSLPAPVSALVVKATGQALAYALDIALFSLRDGLFGGRILGGRAVHSALASASGAIGGTFGLAALAIELPVSTTIMLRAIAAIARDEGEDLADPRTGLACLEVFALAGPPADGEDGETGYFAVRALLARGLAELADLVVERGTVGEAAPILVRFMGQIASRFGIVVSEKIAAQSVAVIGALGGAAVNLAFTEHFQDLARGHFAVRRLERVYGAEAVRADYDRLKSALSAAA